MLERCFTGATLEMTWRRVNTYPTGQQWRHYLCCLSFLLILYVVLIQGACFYSFYSCRKITSEIAFLVSVENLLYSTFSCTSTPRDLSNSQYVTAWKLVKKIPTSMIFIWSSSNLAYFNLIGWRQLRFLLIFTQLMVKFPGRSYVSFRKNKLK